MINKKKLRARKIQRRNLFEKKIYKILKQEINKEFENILLETIEKDDNHKYKSSEGPEDGRSFALKKIDSLSEPEKYFLRTMGLGDALDMVLSRDKTIVTIRNEELGDKIYSALEKINPKSKIFSIISLPNGGMVSFSLKPGDKDNDHAKKDAMAFAEEIRELGVEASVDGGDVKLLTK